MQSATRVPQTHWRRCYVQLLLFDTLGLGREVGYFGSVFGNREGDITSSTEKMIPSSSIGRVHMSRRSRAMSWASVISHDLCIHDGCSSTIRSADCLPRIETTAVA